MNADQNTTTVNVLATDRPYSSHPDWDELWAAQAAEVDAWHAQGLIRMGGCLCANCVN